jgi:hypothetical protein
MAIPASWPEEGAMERTETLLDSPGSEITVSCPPTELEVVAARAAPWASASARTDKPTLLMSGRAPTVSTLPLGIAVERRMIRAGRS